MSTLLKLGLSGYDVKPRFGAFQCESLLQNPLFLGKNFGDTRHPYEKNEPTLDHFGVGCTVRSAGSWHQSDYHLIYHQKSHQFNKHYVSIKASRSVHMTNIDL